MRCLILVFQIRHRLRCLPRYAAHRTTAHFTEPLLLLWTNGRQADIGADRDQAASNSLVRPQILTMSRKIHVAFSEWTFQGSVDSDSNAGTTCVRPIAKSSQAHDPLMHLTCQHRLATNTIHTTVRSRIYPEGSQGSLSLIPSSKDFPLQSSPYMHQLSAYFASYLSLRSLNLTIIPC